MHAAFLDPLGNKERPRASLFGRVRTPFANQTQSLATYLGSVRCSKPSRTLTLGVGQKVAEEAADESAGGQAVRARKCLQCRQLPRFEQNRDFHDRILGQAAVVREDTLLNKLSIHDLLRS